MVFIEFLDQARQKKIITGYISTKKKLIGMIKINVSCLLQFSKSLHYSTCESQSMSTTLPLSLLDQFPKNTINLFEDSSSAIANAANRLSISLTLCLTFCLSQRWNCGLACGFAVLVFIVQLNQFSWLMASSYLASRVLDQYCKFGIDWLSNWKLVGDLELVLQLFNYQG